MANKGKAPMDLATAKGILAEAKEAWEKAATRDEAGEVIKAYGLKIGYKPVIKGVILGVDPEKALKVYA